MLIIWYYNAILQKRTVKKVEIVKVLFVSKLLSTWAETFLTNCMYVVLQAMNVRNVNEGQ